MALDADPDALLPCGTALETLVAQVTADEPAADPDHQAGCAYCQLAIRELAATWSEVRAYARQPVRAPAGLSARIMTEVRALAARVGAGAVLVSLQGNTRISELVLAQVARRAALGVPGVALASALTVIADPVNHKRVRMGLRLVVVLGPALATLGDAVREAIIGQVDAQTGVEVSGVDIAIEDLIADL